LQNCILEKPSDDSIKKRRGLGTNVIAVQTKWHKITLEIHFLWKYGGTYACPSLSLTEIKIVWYKAIFFSTTDKVR